MADITAQIGRYPKLWNIDNIECAGILDEIVQVQEKIDGSQFSFAFNGERVLFRSKNAIIDEGGDIPHLFRPAVEGVLELFATHGLRLGWIYRAEALQGTGHNVIRYENEPPYGFVLYDIEVPGEGYAVQEMVELEAQQKGMVVAPRFDMGYFDILGLEDIAYSEKPVLGGPMIEGIAIKRLPNNIMRGRDSMVIMAKLVREDYREIHGKAWPTQPKKKDFFIQAEAMYNTDRRTEKVIEALRDAGQLTGELRDIGTIVDHQFADIMEEEEAALRELAWSHINKKKLRKALVRGVAERYKEKLGLDS